MVSFKKASLPTKEIHPLQTAPKKLDKLKN